MNTTKVKVLLIGSQQSGKSAIIKKYLGYEFQEEYDVIEY